MREKIEILADFVHLIPFDSNVNFDKFLFAITPLTNSSDEAASWEGSVTTLRRSIDLLKKDINAGIDKKMNDVRYEIAQVSRAVGAIG